VVERSEHHRFADTTNLASRRDARYRWCSRFSKGIQEENTLKRELQRWAVIGYALRAGGLASIQDAEFSRFVSPVASLRSAIG